MFLTGAALIASYPLPTPGKIETYKDWTVGCDNGLSCQAVALKPDGSWDNGLSIVITRPTGAQASLALEISGFSAKADRLRILVDGKLMNSRIVAAGSEAIKFTGAEGLKLARAMAKGSALRLADGSGAEIGTASLAGASAALRYIDSIQGRAGSRNAIVAVGPKRTAGKRSSLPVFEVRKITPSDILPDASALVALSESSPCATERVGSTQDTAYSLGNGKDGAQALILLNCGAGAYNFSSGVYIGNRDSSNKWKFEVAKFDYGASGFTESSEIPLLVNADWDAATQTVSSYSKGRGLGDCGSSESWVWDGSIFRLTSSVVMGECRGSRDWIPVWRAEVKLLS